jgi:choline monooxygenase
MSHEFNVDEDIARANTIDKKFYTDPELFERAKEKLFASSWQYVGHSDQLLNNGDVYPFTLLEDYLNEPLVLTKNETGGICLLSNVCTHRGNIIVGEPCRLKNLRCRYHGRLFQLDGKFLSMPEFKGVENFPSGNDDLKQLPLFTWGKWLFASLNDQLPHHLFFKEMIDRVAWLPLNDFAYRPGLSREFKVKAHWALYCENYLEGFHIPFVHADLNAVIDFGNYTTELFRYSNLQLGIAKDQDDCFDLPPDSVDYGKKIAAYYFFVFPNMMFNFYPWGLSVNVIRPIGIDESKISFYSFVWREEKLNTGAGSGLDKVEMEDEEVVENVQRGIHSRFYEHGRYSVIREQGTHHFHRIVAELLG